MIRIARSAALLALLGLLACDEPAQVDVTPSGCETAIDCLVGEVCRDGACVIEGEGGAGGSAAGGAGGSAVGGSGGTAAGGAGGSAAGGAGGSAAGGAGGSSAGGAGGSAAGGSGGSAAGGAGGQGPTEAERFAARADEIGEAICGLFARCSFVLGPGEVARCGALLFDPAPWILAVQEGRASFDEAAFDACLATLAAAECGPTDPLVDACRFVVPLVPQDGVCHESFECEGDSFCFVRQSCPGTCQPRGGTLQPCANEDMCTSGRCSSYECSPMVEEGAACGASYGPICAPGLACKGSICVRLAADGEACDETNGPVCASNRYCDGTCQFKLAPGAACETARQCTAGTACREAVAGAGLHCEPRGDVGADCVGGCGYGLMCEGGLCLELPATGAPCTEGCRPDDFCNDAGLCERKRDSGEPCTQTMECAGWCDAGRCAGACG